MNSHCISQNIFFLRFMAPRVNELLNATRTAQLDRRPSRDVCVAIVLS